MDIPQVQGEGIVYDVQGGETKTKTMWLRRGLKQMQRFPSMYGSQQTKHMMQNIGVEEAWESDPTAIAATYELKKSSEFEDGFNRPISPRVLRGMWGYPVPVLGAISPLLEPFRGHLSPNIDNVIEKLTLRYTHIEPWVEPEPRNPKPSTIAGFPKQSPKPATHPPSP